MENKKLNLDAPFLSVRRVPTKLEDSNESENTKKKTTTTQRRKVKDSYQETDHEALIRLLQDQSLNHLMEPSSVPFKWGKTPKDPQQTTIEESDLIKALGSVSSAASFSANCSTNGVSEFENNGDGEKSSNVSRNDVILEFRDLIMSRFLPAAEAIAMKQKKESSRVEEERKKKHSIALQRVSMAINQDLNNDDDVDDDDDGDDHNPVDDIGQRVCSNDFKKVRLGYLPRFCFKNSLDVLSPALSQVKTCQDLGVKSGKIVNPKFQDSVYKSKSGPPRILRSNKVMSKSQEPRFLTVSLSKSGEIIRIPRNSSRLQRTTSTDHIQRQETRLLVEEVERRSNINKIRSKNLSVSQPPLPKTPSESWLCRALPRSSAASSIVPGQATGFKKIEQKTNPQSIKWETIVKTSYKHHDHVRYSEELMVVHPSRQHKS
ncbi:hypothetical protein V5N11_020148 [Cardamine amara subsp. amara]|uniref:Uncharacterized protein n=1 Tax=Cardamine amara subsp. amara TaxID=228776 RepID=A0ABD1AQ51_CARAN